MSALDCVKFMPIFQPLMLIRVRKGVYGFYRRIELSENLITIANSDVLFRFKIFSHVKTNHVVLWCSICFCYYYYQYRIIIIITIIWVCLCYVNT